MYCIGRNSLDTPSLPVLERLATEQQRVSVFKPEDLGDYAKDSKPQQKGRDVELFTKDVHEDGAHAYIKDCVRRCINYLIGQFLKSNFQD